MNLELPKITGGYRLSAKLDQNRQVTNGVHVRGRGYMFNFVRASTHSNCYNTVDCTNSLCLQCQIRNDYKSHTQVITEDLYTRLHRYKSVITYVQE